MVSKISSLTEYVGKICELNNALEPPCVIKRETLLFRGQSDEKYELIPSLGRNRKTALDVSVFLEERNLIELAKFKLPDVFNNKYDPLELLALLQHYGIPTRLLDITENALVALYFACCSKNNYDKNGEVVIFKSDDSDVTNYPLITAIADSYRFANNTWCDLKYFFDSAKCQPYFAEQQFQISSKTKEEGAKWIKKCCEKPLFVYAPIRSQRQQAQKGRYILFPNKIEEKPQNDIIFTQVLEPIDKDSEFVFSRIIIPKEHKKQILNELTVMGIDEASLFCDNIEKVCNTIVANRKRGIEEV